MVKFHGLQSKLRTDRFRGGIQFVEQWTNAKAALIGFLTGRGYSSGAIAEILDDGTMPETVRLMHKKWELHSAGFSGDQVSITVCLTTQQRSRIEARAAQEGLSLEEWCKRFLVAGARELATFKTIVGDQFE
jgi:hypothetical protein